MKNFFEKILVTGAILALCGCAGGRGSVEPSIAAKDTRQRREPDALFVPSSYVARPRAETGSQYPSLLSPHSYAIWFTDEVAQAKLDAEIVEEDASGSQSQMLGLAQTLNSKYLIVECYVVSAFEDASIAYDRIKASGYKPKVLIRTPCHLSVVGTNGPNSHVAVWFYQDGDDPSQLVIFPREVEYAKRVELVKSFKQPI